MQTLPFPAAAGGLVFYEVVNVPGNCKARGSTAYSFPVNGGYDPGSGNISLTQVLGTPSTLMETDNCDDTHTNESSVVGHNAPLFGMPNLKLASGSAYAHFVSSINQGTVHTENSTLTISGSDPPIHSININVTSPTEGISFQGLLVGAFSDPQGGASNAGDFTATINWGDGSSEDSSSPKITPTSSASGVYNVSGTHLYSEAGNFTVSVTVSDPDGSGTTLENSIQVGDADLKAGDNSSFFAMAGEQFNGTIAHFSDYNPKAPASDYTIIIDWGDGSPTTKGLAVLLKTSVTGGLAGDSQFNVTGTHQYLSTGTFHVNARIIDKDSSVELANSTAHVGVNAGNVVSSSSQSVTTSVSQSSTLPSGSILIVAVVAIILVAAASVMIKKKR